MPVLTGEERFLLRAFRASTGASIESASLQVCKSASLRCARLLDSLMLRRTCGFALHASRRRRARSIEIGATSCPDLAVFTRVYGAWRRASKRASHGRPLRVRPLVSKNAPPRRFTIPLTISISLWGRTFDRAGALFAYDPSPLRRGGVARAIFATAEPLVARRARHSRSITPVFSSGGAFTRKTMRFPMCRRARCRRD
jgi:hypothetical protein